MYGHWKKNRLEASSLLLQKENNLTAINVCLRKTGLLVSKFFAYVHFANALSSRRHFYAIVRDLYR